MESQVRTVGLLFILYYVVSLVVLGLVAVGAIFLSVFSGDGSAIVVTAVISSSIFFLILLLSVPGLLAGWGLLNYRPWARILAIILSALNLFNFPFGTALGVYGLYVLCNGRTDSVFRREYGYRYI